eukprot:gene16804-biopygen15852
MFPNCSRMVPVVVAVAGRREAAVATVGVSAFGNNVAKREEGLRHFLLLQTKNASPVVTGRQLNKDKQQCSDLEQMEDVVDNTGHLFEYRRCRVSVQSSLNGDKASAEQADL